MSVRQLSQVSVGDTVGPVTVPVTRPLAVVPHTTTSATPAPDSPGPTLLPATGDDTSWTLRVVPAVLLLGGLLVAVTRRKRPPAAR